MFVSLRCVTFPPCCSKNEVIPAFSIQSSCATYLSTLQTFSLVIKCLIAPAAWMSHLFPFTDHLLKLPVSKVVGHISFPLEDHSRFSDAVKHPQHRLVFERSCGFLLVIKGTQINYCNVKYI